MTSTAFVFEEIADCVNNRKPKIRSSCLVIEKEVEHNRNLDIDDDLYKILSIVKTDAENGKYRLSNNYICCVKNEELLEKELLKRRFTVISSHTYKSELMIDLVWG